MASSGLYKRKDSPYWWCNLYAPNGRRVPRSTKCRDKRAAEQARKRLEQENEGLSVDDASPTYPVKDAVADFLEKGMSGIAPATAGMYTQKAGHIVRLLGEKDAARLHFDDVQEYIKAREEIEGAHPHTVQKELITLRRVFKLAEKRQKKIANHRLFMPEHKAEYDPRDRWLTEAEYISLLEILEPHHREWVRVAVYTGGRKGELDRLDWSHVDLKTGFVHMPGTKTEKAKRDVPIEAPLARALARLKKPFKKKAPHGLVLFSWGHVNRDLVRACERIDSETHAAACKNANHKACEVKVTMEPISCNDLRRTFASWLIQKGENPLTVARLMGHASTTMVYRVYAKLTQENLVAAVKKLPDPELHAQ